MGRDNLGVRGRYGEALGGVGRNGEERGVLGMSVVFPLRPAAYRAV
jgi:hypothetical protein